MYGRTLIAMFWCWL